MSTFDNIAPRASLASSMPEETVNLFNLDQSTELPMSIIRCDGFIPSEKGFVIPKFWIQQITDTGTPIAFQISLSWGTDGHTADWRREDVRGKTAKHHENECDILDRMVLAMNPEYDPSNPYTVSDLRAFCMNLNGLAFTLRKTGTGKIKLSAQRGGSDTWVDITLFDFIAPKPEPKPKK